MREPITVKELRHAVELARHRFPGEVSLFLCEVTPENSRGHYRRIEQLPEKGVVIRVGTRGQVEVLVLPDDRPEA